MIDHQTSQQSIDYHALNFPRALPDTSVSGLIKSCVEDFYVEECLPYEPEGSGEHVWLWLEKREQNTEYVARQLARYARLRAMDVGVAGLKDRWAVTRQWFSLYLGNRTEPDWSQLQLPGVQVMRCERHLRKLRRGEHEGNRFRIRVRNIHSNKATDHAALTAELEQRLRVIATRGFPNYFGEQRFGRDGANLERAARYFKGEIKANKSQRGFYLSAVRAYLFNLNLAREIENQGWLNQGATGPLYGDENEAARFESDDEKSILEVHPLFADGLHRNRLKMDRRRYCCIPRDFSWNISKSEIELDFALPSGSFATSLLTELLNVETASPLASSPSTPLSSQAGRP